MQYCSLFKKACVRQLVLDAARKKGCAEQGGPCWDPEPIITIAAAASVAIATDTAPDSEATADMVPIFVWYISRVRLRLAWIKTNKYTSIKQHIKQTNYTYTI